MPPLYLLEGGRDVHGWRAQRGSDQRCGPMFPHENQESQVFRAPPPWPTRGRLLTGRDWLVRSASDIKPRTSAPPQRRALNQRSYEVVIQFVRTAWPVVLWVVWWSEANHPHSLHTPQHTGRERRKQKLPLTVRSWYWRRVWGEAGAVVRLLDLTSAPLLSELAPARPSWFF